MNNKKNLFVTCFYNNLENTILGGRVGRLWHYFHALKSIINMGCDVVVYTSESDKANLESSISQSKYPENVRIIVYDLYSHPYHSYFQECLRGGKFDRCYEIMHGKSIWLSNHLNDGYEFIYWIDCGLAHSGLFPKRYRIGEGYESNFNCTLFTPQMVESLNEVGDKFIILYGDQTYHLFECEPNRIFFVDKPRDENCHIVGGMFGGCKNVVEKFCMNYENLMIEMKDNKCFEREEQLMTVLYFRDKNMFHPLKFTTWHHEESDLGICCNHPEDIPFYKIYENLNKI